MHVGLLLLDLSKAIDCLPHRLLLCKLHTCGVSRDACSLLHSYLSNCFQRVKISASRSDWVQMTKGVPQGSILGPMLFNIFINDLIYVVNDVCPLYNYADDNTLAFFHSDMDILRTKLEEGSNIALDWFDENHMKANISKFQSIILRPKGSISNVLFCISEHILKPIPCVKLLGVKIDDCLSFDDHISSICLRVSYQINGLRRIMKYMTIENRISIYNAFLAANFTYCNTVWHFCSNRGMYMLEKVHKKALRVVLNDYISSYRDLLDKVSKPTLYVARIKAIAIEAYKCYVNENPPYIYQCHVWFGWQAEQPKVNNTYFGLNTFIYQAAKIWNSLPSHLKEASSLFDFNPQTANGGLRGPGTHLKLPVPFNFHQISTMLSVFLENIVLNIPLQFYEYAATKAPPRDIWITW